MSSSARYVTQSHIWDNNILGPLTDKRIAKYQKLGRLAASPFARAAETIKRRIANRKRSAKKTMKTFSQFDL